MQINTEREATISNVGGSSKFKIAASAKAFQILSSGLYERKIEALVRELSTNAYDSHIQSGKGDVPFRIQLPTVMNDFVFAVEDFGVGLSEEEVYNVYTTYFESTKTDSNEVIGALGLGSKTPFSYTDSFTIKARKGGKECVFTAFIGTSGEPEVNKMYERPWAGENGVEVSVEVANKDVSEFTSCAEKVLSWFEVKPECNKELSYYIHENVVDSVRTYGYHFEEGTGYGRRVVCKVLMGNVAYDIDVSDLKDGSEIDRFIGQLYGMRANVYFEVNIGEADVAASRETLSLDDSTKDNLRKRLDKIRREMKENVLAKLSKFGSVFEADVKLSHYEKSLVKDEEINGFRIGGKKDVCAYVTLPRDTQDPEYNKLKELWDIRAEYDISIYERNARNFFLKRSTPTNSVSYVGIVDDKDYKVVVVINDCERKGGIKTAVQENNDLPDDIMVVKDKNTVVTDDLKKLLHYLTKGSYKIVLASSFWDGKLTKTKSVASKGLGKKVVKPKFVTQKGYIYHDYLDFDEKDISRWAYVKGDDNWAAVEGMSSNLITSSDLGRILVELDLDGVILYNGNNERKVKRILGESRELSQMILKKASKKDVLAATKRDVGRSQEGNYLCLFKEFEDIINSLKNVDAKYPVCSSIVFGENYSAKSEIVESLGKRREVFILQLNLLKARSPLIRRSVEGIMNIRAHQDLVEEFREYISKEKEK